jgi:SNF family Na+-dependent transporter
MSKQNEQWGSRVGLILAMAGNAVGLGNFLRFPVEAVKNGGGAFIIPYLVCFILMGIPLVWIEWSMGRFGGKYNNHSTPFIVDTLGKRRFWKYFGVFGIFTNVAVASYYCYIESWTMSYVIHSIRGTFSGQNLEWVSNFFNRYLDVTVSSTGIPYEAVIFFVACLALNTFILSRGLKGIESVAKIGMPMLIAFGAFLAFRGLTLGDSATGAVEGASATDGLNYLWTPQYDQLSNLSVWLAAAGQVFFTLSVGMGTIHCYASYLKANDDVALNGVTAGFTNEFVEVVLGGAIVIPIAAGYLGLDWVKENAGFGMAFQTMPFLFDKWGDFLSIFAGVTWFGLLFFAGITSSLAMGTPWMGFLQDEFNVKRSRAALSFGLLVLALGLPTVLLFTKTGDVVNSIALGEYDYWAGTVSLVVFALAETLLFSWIFGYKNGWKELNSGADIKLLPIFKYVIGYITPTMLIIVFLGALVSPKNNDWGGAWNSLTSGNGWQFDDSKAVISKIAMTGLNNDLKQSEAQADSLAKVPQAEINAHDTIIAQHQIAVTDTETKIKRLKKERTYTYIARFLLIGLFVGISWLVYIAYRKRQQADLKG